MRIVDDAWNAGLPPTGAVVTIGNFDAVHRGHQALIRRVLARADALTTRSAVITFEPHPVKVLHPEAGFRRLTTQRQKEALLAALGVEVLYRVRFTREFAAIEAEAFTAGLLGDRLGVREVHVGRGFLFGRQRRGDLRLLQRVGRQQGFEAIGVDEVAEEGKTISSTRIRRAVEIGAVELAARLLGRPYAVEGSVVAGAGLGRKLGWPTANLALDSELPPASGVYVGEANLADGSRVPAAVNVGQRPTVAGDTSAPTVEAHLLDFAGDLYDRPLELVFHHRLRDERRFPDLPALAARIAVDVDSVREYFAASRR